MERLNVLYSGVFGFHIALVLYYMLSLSIDTLLHTFIFVSGTVGVLLFAVNKETYENRLAFIATVILLVTTFYSSLFLGEAGGQIYRWLVLVIYNIAQSRTMRIVDIKQVSTRNIVFNTLMLFLNLIYSLAVSG